MRKTIPIALLAIVALAASQVFVVAEGPARRTVNRAKPPSFTPQDTERIFFANVNDGLIGERPPDIGKAAAPGTVASVGGSPATSTDGDGGGSAGLYAWSKIISPTAIEDEIKALNLQVAEDVDTPAKVKSGGYKKLRTEFTILAVMFGIAGEYDGDVRWKKDAPEIRDRFARSAANAKVGTIQVFNEAKLRKEELEELIRGAAFASSKAGEPKTDWSAICDRSPLMKRLEVGHQGRMQPFTSSEAEYKGNKEALLHEANVIGAIAEILTQEGMTDAGELEYAALAKSMQKAARDVVDAVKLDNYAQAGKAVGAIGQACSKCHEDWR